MFSKRIIMTLAVVSVCLLVTCVSVEAAPTSHVGMKWTQRGAGITSEHLEGIAWNGSEYLVVGTGGTVIRSTDGITWLHDIALTASHLYDVAYGNGRFVAVGLNGTILAETTGGWTTVSGVTAQDLKGITWNGTRFFAAGNGGTIITSTDGLNWIPLSSGTSKDYHGITCNPKSYNGVPAGSVIVAVGNEVVSKSVDFGLTWTQVVPPGGGAWTTIWNNVSWGYLDMTGTGGEELFLGVGTSGDILRVSTTGGVGEGASGITTENLIDIAWSGKRSLAVGANGTIIQSYDGDYWRWETHSITKEFLTDVVWNGRQFLAVGTNGTILTSTMVRRIYGSDRYSTAVNISKTGWASATTVILARGDNNADALAGVPLAHQYNAPILLTPTNSLNQETKNEIARLGAKNVVILGGPGAVSTSVEQALQGMGMKVDRIWGSNRFATAQQIAMQAPFASADTAVIVYGHNFPDALAVASYAAREGYPILLVNKDNIPQETLTVLNTLPITKTVVVGGAGVISDSVVNQLPLAQRVGGANRFETSVELAHHFYYDAPQYVATGLSFADAITGAALAAQQGSGILLVGKNVPPSVENYLLNWPVSHTPDGMTIFGGSGAVSDVVYTRLQELLK